MTARRALGEGSIYQDADGRWHGKVSMGIRDGGKRDRRHVSSMKRAEVVRKMRELERQRDQGTAGPAGRAPTVEAWLTSWLDTSAAQKVRPSTLYRYRHLVKNQLVPKLGHHKLDRLRPEHVRKAYAEMLASGLAPASVLQAHRVLSRALKVAMQDGRLARNVCTLVDSPGVQREEVKPLTREEAQRILSTAEGSRNAARWGIALALGLRQGEALGLRWEDADMDAGTLAVRRALVRQQGKGLALVEPKSRAGRRTIALPGPLVEALRAHRAAQIQERLVAGGEWQDHGLVFCQVTGRPIDHRRDWADWKRLLKQAGVRDVRLHDARHTAATVMLSLGVPARAVMEVLGHSQIGLTLGTYSHVVPELARDAADKVGEALWG